MHTKAPAIVRHPPNFTALSALSFRPAGLVSNLMSIWLILSAYHDFYLRNHSLAFMNPLLSSVALLTQLESGADLAIFLCFRMLTSCESPIHCVKAEGDSEISCGVAGDQVE
jgi:hypothetical protein